MNPSPVKTDGGMDTVVSSSSQQQTQNQPSGSAPATPVSEWQSLRNQLDQDSFDTSLWNRLIEAAEDSGDLEKVKEAYEALLQKYPNTSSAQIAYLNHFLTNPASFPFAESLFARFLRTSPSVELWKFYIVYVRRINTGPSTRDTVRKAYEFALAHVGQDKDSYEIWNEYIQFLKSGETSTTWEEQQKMDALRKVYHRAVQIPLENVEVLWKDYEAFENGLNKITAKKFMSDLSPSQITAKTVLRELRRRTASLYPPQASSSTTRPSLQLPQRPIYSSADRQLVGAWKLYLKWEESNPLDLEDKAALISRLQVIYRKAMIRMRFFSEIWYLAYVWTSSVGKQDDAINLLKSGIEANPTSFLLNFAYAEVQETLKNNAEVHATYDRLLRSLSEELEAIETRENEATAAAAQNAQNDTAQSGGAALDTNGNGHDPTQPDITQADFPTSSQEGAANGVAKDGPGSAQKSDDKPAKSKELADRRQEYGLVYIMYIRFALRAEGVDASRAAFAKARKDKWTTWEVFEAAALMEYHVAKQLGVANKILGLAHQRFPDEVEFVVRYLAFLMSVNDENNARALFERAIANFPPNKARPLWERWARYEYQYGTLDAALKLEKRMAEAYPNDPPIKRFAQRHTYLNVDGIANRDLGVSLARQHALSRTDTIQSLAPTTSGSGSGSGSGANQLTAQSSTLTKRPSSPDRPLRRSDDTKAEDRAPAHKRVRESSPPSSSMRDRDRDRDRDRWGGSKDRRYGSPAWDRDRDRERDRSPGRRARTSGGPAEREEPEKIVIPQVLSWFVGQLPPPPTFDGPVFRTDDLMQLLRNAVIPSTTRARSPPPPPVQSRPTRPPPDYGPYQGPGSGGRGGRRY